MDHAIPRRREDVLERELPGELVLYDSRTDRVFVLNRTAAAIWRLCDGTATIEDIASCLVAAYPEHADQLRADTASTVDRLADRGLVILGARGTPDRPNSPDPAPSMEQTGADPVKELGFEWRCSPPICRRAALLFWPSWRSPLVRRLRT